MLIEVNLMQKLPEQIQFRNEHGEMVDVGIHYEWRPVFCDKCKKISHLTIECRNLKSKKQWIPKASTVVHENEAQGSDKTKTIEAEVDQEGFQRALKPIRVRVSPIQVTHTTNGINVLDTENQEKGECSLQGQQRLVIGDEDKEGGDSLMSNG